MDVIGIIAEYNPFHNGHIYHIEKIKEKYPDLTRGIVLNDNYTYNQELSEKIIFINIGGYENDIVEVKNTIDLLGPIIKEVLDEEN